MAAWQTTESDEGVAISVTGHKTVLTSGQLPARDESSARLNQMPKHGLDRQIISSKGQKEGVLLHRSRSFPIPLLPAVMTRPPVLKQSCDPSSRREPAEKPHNSFQSAHSGVSINHPVTEKIRGNNTATGKRTGFEPQKE